MIQGNQEENLEKPRKMNSMPIEITQNMEPNHQLADKQQSLPINIEANSKDKENKIAPAGKSILTKSANESDVKNLQSADMIAMKEKNKDNLVAPTLEKNQNLSDQLGDSLIEMISNLKNENQKLAEALKTNEEFVRERIEEFKRATEDVKKCENQYATNKLEYKDQVRKLHHQNLVLNERLKNMETKLKDTKLDDNSGKSIHVNAQNMYPELDEGENISDTKASTVQVDATGDESNVNNVLEKLEDETYSKVRDKQSNTRSNFNMDKSLKQCYQLEKQLNKIEKRDLEICVLKQKLSILKGDLISNSMNNFQASSQIELLRTEIENLANQRKILSKLEKTNNSRVSLGDNCDESIAKVAAAKLGYRLSKRAVRSDLKAAKYASKKAYREQKVAAIAAASICENIPVSSSYSYCNQQCQQKRADVEPQVSRREGRHLHRYHSTASQHQHLPSLRKLKSDLVGDIVSTANKAVLTGYKVASTHVNLALDKLSQFEQTQAQNLTKNKAASEN